MTLYTVKSCLYMYKPCLYNFVGAIEGAYNPGWVGGRGGLGDYNRDQNVFWNAQTENYFITSLLSLSAYNLLVFKISFRFTSLQA